MSESAPEPSLPGGGDGGRAAQRRGPADAPVPPVFQNLDRAGISWKVYGFTQWYERFAYVQQTRLGEGHGSRAPTEFADGPRRPGTWPR